jgi:plastocyanin domain-containing protein
VTVRGGYSPELIHVRQGVPLEIEFDRQESGECTNRVAFADLGVNAGLPAYTKTTVSSPTPPACTPPMPLTVVATKGIHLGGAGTMTTTSDQ